MVIRQEPERSDASGMVLANEATRREYPPTQTLHGVRTAAHCAQTNAGNSTQTTRMSGRTRGLTNWTESPTRVRFQQRLFAFFLAETRKQSLTEAKSARQPHFRQLHPLLPVGAFQS